MWVTGGDVDCVGLAAFDFRLKAGVFLLLGNNPSFLLFAERELFFAPGLVAEAIILSSLPATGSPDMGIELDWSCYDLRGSGRGGGSLSLMLIQKEGANTRE